MSILQSREYREGTASENKEKTTKKISNENKHSFEKHSESVSRHFIPTIHHDREISYLDVLYYDFWYRNVLLIQFFELKGPF